MNFNARSNGALRKKQKPLEIGEKRQEQQRANEKVEAAMQGAKEETVIQCEESAV